jgi:hypothetical protein
VEYKGGHSDIQGEEKMRKRSKKGRALYSVRGPDGRFSKALPLAPTKGQVEETGIDGIKAVETWKGRPTPIECYELSVERVYYHPKLVHSVKVRQYDQFTNDLLRQF